MGHPRYSSILMVSSGTVKPFNGVLRGIKLTAGSTQATCQVKNSATGSTIGHVIAGANVAAAQQEYDVVFDTSLYVSLAGTGAIAIIEYE